MLRLVGWCDLSVCWLQVAQLDLVQLHWWDYNIPGMVDTAKALADLQAKGLIKQVRTRPIVGAEHWLGQHLTREA